MSNKLTNLVSNMINILWVNWFNCIIKIDNEVLSKLFANINNKWLELKI